jgi:hypothetical protein
MPTEVSTADLVRQLRRVGLRPSERLAAHIFEQGDAAVEPLLELACDTALLHDDEPACYGPVHALRLLGELRPLPIIVPLLEHLPVSQRSPDDRAPLIWVNEVPQIIGRLGAEAVEPLRSVYADQARPQPQRAAAVQSLAYAAVYAPETRADLLVWLRQQFATVDDPSMAAYLVTALAQLGAAETYAEVMAAYRDGRVNREIIGPGEARQLLLSKNEKRLGCVNHPLWERYDEHGPFSKEEYALADEFAYDYDELDDEF